MQDDKLMQAQIMLHLIGFQINFNNSHSPSLSYKVDSILNYLTKVKAAKK